MSDKLIRVAVSSLQRNPSNPQSRVADEELIQSIDQYGIRTPLLVKTNGAPDKFVIIAGERRWDAAKRLKLDEVPVIVTEFDGKDADAFILVDNIHRKNMNMYEEYQVITLLLKTLNIAQVASKLKKSTLYVTRRMNLGNLIKPIVDAITNENTQGLTERIVFLLAQCSQSIQKKIWEDIHEEYQTIDKKKVIKVIDEDYVERKIRSEISTAFFGGKVDTKEAFALMSTTTGKSAIAAALEAATSETKAAELFNSTVPKPSEEKIKEVRKTLKAIQNSVRLSTILRSVQGDDIYGVSEYRLATKEDDKEKVMEGVFVDGPNIGKLVQFVEVKPEKKEADKPKKSEKQIEKERAERRQRIFDNKVQTMIDEDLATYLMTEAAAKQMGKDLKATAGLVMDNTLNHSFKTAFLRAMLTKEEYSAIDLMQVDNAVKKMIKNMSPTHGLFAVLLAPLLHTVEGGKELAKVIGFDLNAARKSAVKHLEEEAAKAKAEKEAKKTEKK